MYIPYNYVHVVICTINVICYYKYKCVYIIMLDKHIVFTDVSMGMTTGFTYIHVYIILYYYTLYYYYYTLLLCFIMTCTLYTSQRSNVTSTYKY